YYYFEKALDEWFNPYRKKILNMTQESVNDEIGVDKIKRILTFTAKIAGLVKLKLWNAHNTGSERTRQEKEINGDT
ncbi:1139_t:CDS:2, partial [Acaulospora morrowiae]